MAWRNGNGRRSKTGAARKFGAGGLPTGEPGTRRHWQSARASLTAGSENRGRGSMSSDNEARCDQVRRNRAGLRAFMMLGTALVGLAAAPAAQAQDDSGGEKPSYPAVSRKKPASPNSTV